MGKRKRKDVCNVLVGAQLYQYHQKYNSCTSNDNDDKYIINSVSKITAGSRCNYRIQMQQDKEQGILASLVLPNRICVLVFNGKKSLDIRDDIAITITSISYTEGFQEKTKEVTGKKKKNSIYIEAGDTICIVYYKTNDDDNIKSYKLCSPIGGHLLETNDNIIKNPNLVIEQSNDQGYVAVLFPTYDIVNTMTGGGGETIQNENNLDL
jgi:glycine cleavage system H lipoate-binding protein